MTKYLFGLSGCYDAFVVAPVVRAVLARGEPCHVAWFGTKEEYEVALSLGLPDVDATIAGPVEGDELVAAHEFAGDDWFGCEVVLTVGSDAFALALAQAMAASDREVVRLGAGVRCRGDRNRWRVLADHAAEVWCAPNEACRQQLILEGCAPDHVVVVGSLVAEAVGVGAPTHAPPPTLFAAIERAGTPACAGGLDRLLSSLRVAADAGGLQLRAAPTVLADAVADAELDAGGLFEPSSTASGQLDTARSASLIVTDSLGWQEVAAALGVPCVVLADADGGVRSDLVATDHVTIAADVAGLPDAVTTCLRKPRPTSLPHDDAAASVLRAIDGWLDPAGSDRAAPPREHPSLPTEGDISGRTFDDVELANVAAVLGCGTLNSTRGTQVHRFEQQFAEWQGSKHAIACASGSAAVHCAIAALGLSAGDEVITTPITDMGALTPIFYEGGVPVFADVDPDTLNVTAATIEAQLTDRTRAIIVTHLFGMPCELDDIVALADRHDLPLIEDTAQAFGATWRERKLGTFGRLSAFSLQQGKHITTGEGGVVCTDDDELARRVFLYVNKAWGYGDARPDHYFPALNYRMTELQGAVACGQLPKLDAVVASRRDVAARLREQLGALDGLHYPDDPAHGTHSYWKFAFRVDADRVPGGAVGLGARMREQGIACAPRYVQKPAFECQLFRDWQAHPVSSLPLTANPRGVTEGPLFDRVDYPGAIRGLEQVIVLPINERYQPEHVRAVATAIQGAHREHTDG